MAFIPNLVLYYKPTCPYCLKVLAYMQEQDIAMEMRNTMEPGVVDDLMALTGKTPVPCLVIDGTPMTATANPYPSGTHTHAGDLDVVSDGTFEDNTHVVIGAPAPRQFQIGFLSNPVRMVIDIRD